MPGWSRETEGRVKGREGRNARDHPDTYTLLVHVKDLGLYS